MCALKNTLFSTYLNRKMLLIINTTYQYAIYYFIILFKYMHINV